MKTTYLFTFEVDPDKQTVAESLGVTRAQVAQFATAMFSKVRQAIGTGPEAAAKIRFSDLFVEELATMPEDVRGGIIVYMAIHDFKSALEEWSVRQMMRRALGAGEEEAFQWGGGE